MQCNKIRKGYVLDNDRIYHNYQCLKEKGHEPPHQFYREEQNLPIFKKYHDASLYRKQLARNKK